MVSITPKPRTQDRDLQQQTLTDREVMEQQRNLKTVIVICRLRKQRSQLHKMEIQTLIGQLAIM